MNKQLTLRHMEHSPTLESYVNEQAARIEKFLEHEREPKTLHIVLDAQRTHHHHHVEINLKTPNYDLFCEYEAPEMHDAIKHAFNTMYHLLTQAKKKSQDERRS